MKKCSLLSFFQTGIQANPASYETDIVGSFHGGKMADG
jgi:hypothetical protein